MMNIEWDESVVAPRRGPKPGLWDKIKSRISVVSRDPPGQQRGRRPSFSRPSTPKASSSSNRPKTPLPPRSKSHGDVGPRTARPHLTVIPSNGAPYVAATPIKKNGAYTYVIQSPAAASPVRYASPTQTRPQPQRHATAPHSPRASQKKSHSSPPPTNHRPPPHRSATSGGVMLNGKLIVGDPEDVARYVNAQKSVERWARNVR